MAFVEDRVGERETIREIETPIDLLPEDERTVARLKVLIGHDIRGAAHALGQSRSRVAAIWRRTTRKFIAWKGTKSGHEALRQALILARYPEAQPIEDCCVVVGCARLRHAHGRCQYHYQTMLARRQQLAAKRQWTVSTSA